MKKQKKVLVIILIFVLILLVSFKVFVSNASNLGQQVQYSEQYQKWLELSAEEKENVIRPRMYDVRYSTNIFRNPLLKASMLRTKFNPSYTLQDVISNNLIIKDQQQTSSCWAFAALSSLETNLALANYKNGTNTSKVYDYSERHMEYATSRIFENNEVNSIGYNRVVGSGGNWDLASSYLTNGSGAINEAEMPFENNEDSIDISEIQGKTIASQVYDTAEFADYNSFLLDENESNEIKNQIKNHIQNYGAVYGGIEAGGSFFSMSKISSNGTVSVGRGSYADHAISIIGWDDNYSKSNWDEFEEIYRPTSDGAWIARNSWGEEAGDNGLIYISYEDKTLSLSLSGIMKSTDTVEYENIYQYDYYYPNSEDVCGEKMMLCNVFDRKTSETEYLTQVSLHVPGTYTCRVFVNPNGTGKSKNDLQLVSLKAGESETFNAGYHTLEFAEPIEITSNQFAVAIEISSIDGSSVYGSYVKKDSNLYSSVEIQTGKCFKLDSWEYRNEDNWSGWEDLSEDEYIPKNSTIKAFTTSELIDESLKNIEIITPPTKTEYWAGEDFDKSGMVVKANYNSKKNPSVILDNSSYSIINGTNLKEGQTSVTIKYEDKTVEQPIKVTENKVENIEITIPPTKTEYWAGEDFDKSGMVVKAIYTDGTTLEVKDYTILNGSNLKNDQSSIIVSYEGKTIEQAITVKANSVVKIEILQAPNKTNYVVGQNFNSVGMIVKATYANGIVKEITDYEVINGNNLSASQTTVTIVYEEQTATQAIVVVEKEITQISVKTMPTKTKYIQNKEELDLTGGVIEITYNDATTESIEMNSAEVTATGFSNNNLGTISITLIYQTETTQFEVEIIGETVIDENAENSKMDNAVADIKKVKAYYFTENSQKDYILIEVEVNEIEKSVNNDKMEYYYYLSSNKNEKNITDWVKIEENQTKNNNIKFTIDTTKISNYNEISNAEEVYLYVKEVATKGGNQSVVISNPMKLETDVEVEIYLDNIKKENNNSSNNTTNISDNTVAESKLPNAGSQTFIIIVAIIIISTTCIICYKKYSWFKDIK